MTPRDFNRYANEVTNLYRTFEREMFLQIAKRLKGKKSITAQDIPQWQISQLGEIRRWTAERIRQAGKLAEISKQAMEAMLETVGEQTIQGIDQELREKIDIFPVAPSMVDAVIRAYGNQTWLDIQNFVNQTLLTTHYGNNAVVRMYERIINETAMKVLTGVRPFDRALAETVIRWNKKGISSSFIDKGGHRWSAERYVHTVLKSTIGNVFNELRMSRMREFGIDLVLMSSKSDARPMCALCQGTVMTMKPQGYGGYHSIYEYGYGTPAGVRGINCGHMLWPYIEGTSSNHQEQYDSVQAVNRYQVIQRQRQMEARIRNTKQRISISNAAGSDQLTEKYRKALNRQRKELREYVREYNLVRDPIRERIFA